MASICDNVAFFTHFASMYSTTFHSDHIFPNPVLSDGYCRFGTFLSHEVANCRSKSFFAELLNAASFATSMAAIRIARHFLVSLVLCRSAHTFILVAFTFSKKNKKTVLVFFPTM